MSTAELLRRVEQYIADRGMDHDHAQRLIQFTKNLDDFFLTRFECISKNYKNYVNLIPRDLEYPPCFKFPLQVKEYISLFETTDWVVDFSRLDIRYIDNAKTNEFWTYVPKTDVDKHRLIHNLNQSLVTSIFSNYMKHGNVEMVRFMMVNYKNAFSMNWFSTFTRDLSHGDVESICEIVKIFDEHSVVGSVDPVDLVDMGDIIDGTNVTKSYLDKDDDAAYSFGFNLYHPLTFVTTDETTREVMYKINIHDCDVFIKYDIPRETMMKLFESKHVKIVHKLDSVDMSRVPIERLKLFIECITTASSSPVGSTTGGRVKFFMSRDFISSMYSSNCEAMIILAKYGFGKYIDPTKITLNRRHIMFELMPYLSAEFGFFFEETIYYMWWNWLVETSGDTTDFDKALESLEDKKYMSKMVHMYKSLNPIKE